MVGLCNIVNSITENTSDFLSEGSEYGLGVAGKTMDVSGNTISGNIEGIKKSAKELGSDTWGLTKTAVADAGPLALQAVSGGIGGTLPIDGIARDILAVSHMTANVVQTGKVGNVIPENLGGAIGYTIARSIHGVEYADSLTKKTPDKSVVEKKEQNPNSNQLLLKKMKEKGRG